MLSGVVPPYEFVTNKYNELGFRKGGTVYWFKQVATPAVDRSGEWEALPPKIVRRPTERIPTKSCDPLQQHAQ